MKYSKVVVAAVLALVLSSCGFGGGDDTELLSANEGVTPVPTANNVQPLPAATAVPAQAAPAAAAPLPTAITLPATPVPPTATPDRSQPTTYVVQSGDVLGLIAERYDVDVAELRRVNGLSGNLIKVGQQLTIPAAVAAGTATTASAAPAAAPTAPPRPTTPPAPVSCPAGAVGHCVQSGDSLLGIASKYGVSVDALRSANPSISGDLIRMGDVLALPGGGGSTATTTTTTTTTGGSGTTVNQVLPTVGPASDADCAARNFEYPYFHAADGKCYANPFNATVTPVQNNAGNNDGCPEGTFKWTDGLCYPIPGATTTATTVAPTTSSDASETNYGTAPCRDGYVELTNGRCWPKADTTNPTTVTPVP